MQDESKSTMTAIEVFPGVVSDSQIWSGKPLIKGRRIPVSLIIEQLADGLSAQEVSDAYGLTEDEVRTALEYAAMRVETITVSEVESPTHVSAD